VTLLEDAQTICFVEAEADEPQSETVMPKSFSGFRRRVAQ